jgi:hypothetical protein
MWLVTLIEAINRYSACQKNHEMSFPKFYHPVLWEAVGRKIAVQVQPGKNTRAYLKNNLKD